MSIPLWAAHVCVCLVSSLIAMGAIFVFVEVLWVFLRWAMRATGVYGAFLAFLWTRNSRKRGAP